MAQLEFQPDFDWSVMEAAQLYKSTYHAFQVDQINYSNCISGLQEIPKGSVDLVIADPPFGIDFDKIGSQYNRDDNFVIEGYQEIEEEYDKFTYNWIKELPRVMKETSSAYLFSGWTNLIDLLNAIDKVDLHLINHIIWKYQFGVFTKRKFVSSHYHILFLVKDEDKYFFNKIDHYPEDVWEIPRIYRPGQKKNSTKLPEQVVLKCIDFSTKPGDLVLDPFMGNGTTAVCARGDYRHYYGFEVNENLKEIIENNIKGTELGEFYQPYVNRKPSPEELAQKYPAVRKYLEKNKKEKRHRDLGDYI